MKHPRSTRSMAAIGALALVTLAGALPASAKNDNAPPDHANRPPAPPGKVVDIDIAAISDFHGQLVETSSSGGVLGVSGAIEALRESNPETLFVANGDSVGGSAYESAILQDMPTLNLLNAMGLDLSNAGNHEFDKGWADFRDRIMPASDFPYLNANLTNTPELADYTIAEVAGVSVAFVGTMTEEFPTLVSPTGIEGIEVSDPVAATNMVAGQLSDGRKWNGEADVIVALTHSGFAGFVDGDFSRDVDAVFTGHTHAPYEGSIATEAGNEIPLMQPAASGATISHVTLQVRPASGKVLAWMTDTMSTIDYVDGATAEVQTILDQALAESAEAGKAVVGAVSDDLLLPGGYNGNRGAESTIGTFLGGVALWQGDQITDADFGVINPGGIRANFLYAGDTTTNPLNVDGAVTYAEAFSVQPFGNTMAYVDLTGEQVDLLLEQQLYPRGSRPMLRLGLSENVQYVFDINAPEGSRVSDLFIDGAPVDPAASYTVAGNSFLLAGGDDFTVFQDGANYVDTGIIDLQSLIDYFQVQSPVAPLLSQGSTGLTLSGELVPGASVTASIYSLAFTNGETSPATVTLYVGGEEVGSGAVTIDPVLNSDITGEASITFTVPASATADSEIRIVTDDGYTDITF